MRLATYARFEDMGEDVSAWRKSSRAASLRRGGTDNRQAGSGEVQTSRKSRVHADARSRLSLVRPTRCLTPRVSRPHN